MRGQASAHPLASLLAAVSALVLTCLSASADEPPRRTFAVTLNAGEMYIIKDVEVGSTPGVHVVDNPNALLVHGEKPGELVVLGAAAGEWKIDVTQTDGSRVTYDFVVHAVAEPFTNPTRPGKNPPVIGDTVSAPLSAGSPRATEVPRSGIAAPPALGKPAAPSAAGAAVIPLGPATVAAETRAGQLKAPSATPAPAGERGTAASRQSPESGPTGSLMTSQSAPAAIGGPIRKFKADPLVPEAGLEPGSRPAGTHYLPDDAIVLPTGNSKIFDFPSRLRRVSIADTTVADLQVVNPYQLNLIAHKTGFTTLAIWDVTGRYVERQVRVDPGGRQQVLLNVIVAELNRQRMENQGVNLSMALTRLGISLVSMVGTAATPYTPTVNLAEQAVVGAGASAVIPPPGVVGPGGQIIPLLLSPNLTYGLSSGNSNVQFQEFFQFLETHELAKILAEPHLLANSGQKAEFLSGGEIPIVIAQALNTSIVFKQFGTSVKFIPTVVGRDVIELEVRPEVSEPDFAHGVQLFGFTVPAFVTRRAQTLVRLRNNQTLIIAGLILHTPTSIVQKVPYLGDIPYIRELFRNTSYQDVVTDLVMSVTPQIVGPLPEGGETALPIERGPLTDAEIRTQRLPVPNAARPRF